MSAEEPNQEPVVTGLKEQPNFLAVQYNENLKKDKPQRAGGVYVPPHKLRAMQEKMLQEEDSTSVNYQRLMWELLRKSINGIINKVNISNIQNIVVELFNENILRGMGLLAKAIIKAQMASPNFTHVYAALIAVINTKLPQIGNLIITRVMILFHRSFHRNNKIVCMATTKMIAHLINQRVLGEFVGLQMLMMMLMHPTDDSVEIACDFMIEVGQVFSQITPKGANVVFERFKSLLHEGQIGQKAQYSIQNLFAIRKTGFKEHPGVIPQLDLVQLEDQITHQMDFEEDLTGKEGLNVFKEDKNYLKTQAEWDEIKQQILGQENIINLKQMKNYQEEIEEYENQNQEQGIKDLTQQDLINLRRTIYLAIQSTVSFEECAHKILKMNIAKGYEIELVDMILECCMMERIYQDFFGFLAERFCKINDLYKELFVQAFVKHYNSIFKQEGNKIRNLAELFGHLFYSYSIDWKIFQVVTLRQDTTTAAHRIFLKYLFKKIVQHLGMDRFQEELNKEQMKESYQGLFPFGHPNDIRFAINFWRSIGLGRVTQEMQQVLNMQMEMLNERRFREEEEKMRRRMEEEEEMLKLEEMERQKEREIQREKEKEKKQLQRRMKEVERRKQQKEKQREREKYRERQRQRQKERQRQRKYRYKDKQKQRQKQRIQQKKNKRREELSSSSDSSDQSSSETPKKRPPVPRRMRSEESQSSGFQSSSDENSRESISRTPKQRKNERKRKFSESSSSSSSDSSSEEPKRRRKVSRSREKRREKQRKRYRSSSSERVDQRRRRY